MLKHNKQLTCKNHMKRLMIFALTEVQVSSNAIHTDKVRIAFDSLPCYSHLHMCKYE